MDPLPHTMNHEGLAMRIARRFTTLPFDDAVQVCRITIWRCSASFDPTRGVRFASYAGQACYAELCNMYNREKRHMLPSLPENYEGQAYEMPDPHEYDDMPATVKRLHAAIRRLPPKQRADIRSQYGIGRVRSVPQGKKAQRNRSMNVLRAKAKLRGYLKCSTPQSQQ